MKATELWPQIRAAPNDKKLKEDYLEALEQEGDPRAEVLRVAVELNYLVHGYFEREATLTRQYETLLAPWQAELIFVVGWPCELTIATL